MIWSEKPTFLSRRNFIQKVTIWSLILYVCTCDVVWLYPSTLIYSHGTWTQWSFGRVTPQQTWCRRGHWPLVKVFEKKVTVSTCFHVILWESDTIVLEYSCTCYLNRSGVKSHLGVIWVIDRLVKDCEKLSLYLHILIYFRGI